MADTSLARGQGKMLTMPFQRRGHKNMGRVGLPKPIGGLAATVWMRMGLSYTQIAVVLVPSVSILLAILAAKLFFGVLFSDFSADPAFLAKMHPLKGSLSNLGVLLWNATTVACLFTAAVLRARGARESFRFFLSAGLLSGYLTFDDMFMIHEYLVPRYLGVSEKWFVGCLGIVAAVFFIRFRQVILRSEFGLLVLALGFLSLSVVVDLLGNRLYQYGDWQFVGEDAPKWLGIACWCGYYLRTCYRAFVDHNRHHSTDG